MPSEAAAAVRRRGKQEIGINHIRALKVAAEHNTADGKTKCVDVKTYWRHMTYTHNVSVDVLRSVYGVKTELIERATGGEMICMLIS